MVIYFELFIFFPPKGNDGVEGVCRALHVWYEVVPRDFCSTEMEKMMPSLLTVLKR